MEKMILLLKNVYVTLMTEDFLIYSASVIGRAERKGHTIWQQEYALAETFLKENLRDDVPATPKAASNYVLAECAEFQGNAEMSLSWLNQGVDYVKCHSKCDENVAFYLNAAACVFYVKFGMQDAARLLVEWLSERIGSRTGPEDLYQYAMAVGTYELYFGDPERVLEHYQIVCKDEFFRKMIQIYLKSGDRWQLLCSG